MFVLITSAQSLFHCWQRTWHFSPHLKLVMTEIIWLQVRLESFIQSRCSMNEISNLIKKVQYSRYHIRKVHQKIQGRRHCHTHLHVIFRKWRVQTPAAEMATKIISLVDYHFKNRVLSDFPVKQNRQTLILIPSLKSHTDLTQFVPSQKRWFVVSVHKRKWRLLFQNLKGKICFCTLTCENYLLKSSRELNTLVFVSVALWELRRL